MARIEVRKFKSKSQLLVIAETGQEYELIKNVLGLSPIQLKAEVASDPWETYIRLAKPILKK